jgi:hypothetical protein
VALNTNLNSAFANAVQIKETKERQLTQLLHDHDQAFHSLQKLAPPRGAVAGSEMDSDLKSLQLVNILVKFTCEEMHCRLDRIYLEQLHRPLGEEYGVEECPSDQELSLKSDLDSLYAEIRDVVAMSLAQEFEHPLIKSQQEDRRHQLVSEDLSNQHVRDLSPCPVLGPNQCRYSALCHGLRSHFNMLSTVLSHFAPIVHRLMQRKPSTMGLTGMLS